MSIRAAATTLTLFLLCHSELNAASLQVQPALLDVAAPGAASTITLRNTGDKPISVQVRVFRWSTADGKDKLEPTDQVIASPPAIALSPNTDYVARVVRVVKQPVVGEEAYRLLVDELPDAQQSTGATIKILVRHSVPVFFSAPERSPASVNWLVRKRGNQLTLEARNSGDTRLRVSALSVRDISGNTVSFGAGLVGYALGKSSIRWTAPVGVRGFSSGGSVAISGQGNDGPIRATASINSGS